MKATYHNGRASKGGKVYNANHNTLAETRNQQRHIDHELTMENKIWVRDLENLESPQLRETEGSFDASAYELDFYKKRYGEARERKNADYVKSGHKDDVRTMEQVIKNPKTAPLETIFQIGTMTERVEPEVLERATKEFINWMQKEYGSNMDVLDVALHVDEATPHIHARCVLFGRDKEGNRDVNQSGAFRELKIERPDPTKKQGKYNSPLMTFTERNRQQFYDICQSYGLEIDREVRNPSQKNLEVLEYKTEKLQEELNRANEKLRQYEQQAQEAQRQEMASVARKEKIERVAAAARKEALDFHSQTIEEATQVKAAAEVTAAAIVERAENEAEQIIVNADEKAQKALEAAERAEQDKELALQVKADTEAQTALYKQEGERIIQEAQQVVARLEQDAAETKARKEVFQAEIDEMIKMGYKPSQIDKVKREMDRVKKESTKQGLWWFGDQKVSVTYETLEGLYAKATRYENLEEYAHKLDLRERDVKSNESFVESQFQKIREEKMELHKREQAIAAPEAERAQAIHKEVQKRLEVEMPLVTNRANMYEQAAAERDRLRKEVNEYHDIASRLEIGQGIKLQRVIDAVHESKTQNITDTVLSAVNYIRNGYEWASQEIKQIVQRAKETLHHHIHRKR